MKSVKKEVSFRRKLMTAVLSVTLPLIALLLFSNLYSTQAFNRKIADSNMRTMDYRAGRMEEQLDSVNDFLTGLTVSDDYRTLSGGEKTPLKAYLASYTLITQLKTALPAYGDVGAFFIYSAPSDAERDIFDDSIPYAQKERLRAFVRDAVENNTYSYNVQWRHAEIGGKAYLFRFYGGRRRGGAPLREQRNGQQRRQRLPVHGDGTGLQNFAGGILRIGHNAQPQTGHIFLFAVFRELHSPGGLSHNHWQYAGGHGIQRAAVAHPLFFQNPPDLGADIHAGPAGGFIDYYNAAGHRRFLIS